MFCPGFDLHTSEQMTDVFPVVLPDLTREPSSATEAPF